MNVSPDMSSSGLEVSEVGPADEAAAKALIRAAYAEYEGIMDPAAWRGLRGAVERALTVGRPATWLKAEREGRLLGTVMLFPARVRPYGEEADTVPWPEVRLLSVDPVARGEGVGKALLEECVLRARADGAATIGLHTSRSMVAAIRMYRRMGFERRPDYDFHPPGAELVEAYALDLRTTSPPGPKSEDGERVEG
jgi:GNAT superfamily N-acetyltransferase